MHPELNLIIGPMFSGKSTYLINKVNYLLNNNISENEILIINHSDDIRYSTNKICSHDGTNINSKSLNNLSDIITNIINDNKNNSGFYTNIKYILIDEGQFFNDLFESIKSLLLYCSNSNFNKNTHNKLEIYICGLDGDYKQEPFQNSRILELIPYSTNITKLNSQCNICKNTAPFTKRIINSDKTILIGGNNFYQPVCLIHLNK
jgi:thymidine kinase